LYARGGKRDSPHQRGLVRLKSSVDEIRCLLWLES
jgi:hypothetical protein